MTPTRILRTGPTAPQRSGVTLWLTGLPSAGKTTLAFAVAERLRAVAVDVEVLDGDEVRTHLSAGLGFSRADRDTHVDRIGFVAELLSSHGVVVIVPVIAPYSQARQKVRARHLSAGTAFALVHVSTTLQVCVVRDVKGLYARAFRGEITSMTGVDDPYEIPQRPELTIDTATVDQRAAVGQLLDLLAGFGVAIGPAQCESTHDHLMSNVASDDYSAQLSTYSVTA